jgi:hypothetical protein
MDLLNAKTTATVSNSDAAPTNYCLEARVDWMTESGHYDAHASRNCAATGSTARTGTLLEPANWGGRTVTGLQKAAGYIYGQYPVGDPAEY